MKKMYAIACLVVAPLIMMGATECDQTQSSTTTQNAVSVEQNQQRLMKAIPAPQLTTSLERANLVERLERLNQQNMHGYIYLLSYGRVVSFYPIRGKVTSLNAYLMAQERPISDNNCSGAGCASVMVEQPDYDGAYGENDRGIFFFTADTNAYVEWKGDYQFSDQPLKLAEQPLMTREVK